MEGQFKLNFDSHNNQESDNVKDTKENMFDGIEGLVDELYSGNDNAEMYSK